MAYNSKYKLSSKFSSLIAVISSFLAAFAQEYPSFLAFETVF